MNSELHSTYYRLVDSIVAEYSDDEDERRDLAQSAWLRILANWDKFNPQKSAESTWIYTLTHNLCRDEIRKNSVRPTLVLESDLPRNEDMWDGEDDSVDGTWLEEHSVEYADPEQILMAEEALEKMDILLADIPLDQYQVFLLSKEGFTSALIAEALGISVTNTTSILSRVRQTLTENLNSM